jgi:superfamily I DNA/RNA helicase
MNVDDQYRIVAVLEGDAVLFEMVGNHDDTLKRGARATLREYERRLTADPETLLGRRSSREVEVLAPEPAPTLFGEQPPALQQLLDEPERMSDLMMGDLFGALRGYADGTIEDWMIFLSPLQRRAVSRAVNGPARVNGGPGTGKTVVGLHRAAGFARDAQRSKAVLVTSFVKNIPETLEGLFGRLAPDATDRVTFRHLHELAVDLIEHRRVPANPDWNAARARFDRVMADDPSRAGRLRAAGFDVNYLWQEVTRVIQGRGITELDAYLALERYGRRRAMQPETRRLVWGVYEQYREACERLPTPLADPERVLQLALEAVRREPTGRPYEAIVVDEAQDLTEVGIRLLLELLADGPRGRLLLVGDHAQRVYAGGFHLSDIGVDVRGRSTTLRVCYRSTDEIMQAVAALGRELSAEDFGEDGLSSLAASTVRNGRPPSLVRFRTTEDEIQWLIAELRASDDIGSIAILVPTNARVDEWANRLKIAEIPCIRLEQYAGKTVAGVKVGTYARSKGLEFKHVYLPGLSDRQFPWGDRSDIDSILLQGSMLYVAMSRARDELTMSTAGDPSYLVAELNLEGGHA